MPPLTLDQYDHLWSISEIPMAVVDLGNRFVRCNRAYCHLLGYSESELKLRKWTQVTHPDDVDGDLASVAALRADEASSGYDLIKRYLTKNGKIITVQLSVLAIRDDAEVLVGYFVTALLIQPEQPPRQQDTGFSIWKWAVQHPKDSAIVLLGGGLLLGRDTIIELLKLWLGNK
jgi:PAS domain S-box-containing protein